MVSREMELTMNMRRILMTTAAVALLMPLLAPTTSFAFGHGGGSGGHMGGGGGGMHMGGGGGGMHMGGGGGGMHIGGGGGGIHMGGGGGGWHGGGITAGPRGMANAAAGGVAVSGGVPTGGGGWRGGHVAMGNGGWRGGGGGWHGGHFHHRGFFPGAVAGAAIGGALAYDYYGGPDYYYGPNYDDSYYDDGYADNSVVAVVPGEVGVDANYCAQRYRSYDPGSGTYLGYDGMRHPCP